MYCQSCNFGICNVDSTSNIHPTYDKQLKEIRTNQGWQTVNKYLFICVFIYLNLMSVLKVKLSVTGAWRRGSRSLWVRKAFWRK